MQYDHSKLNGTWWSDSALKGPDPLVSCQQVWVITLGVKLALPHFHSCI